MKRLSFILLILLCAYTGRPAQNRLIDSEKRVEFWLNQQDKNKDGRIARNESAGLMNRFFDRNDTNKDGFLDQTELIALAKRTTRNPVTKQAPARKSGQQSISTEALMRRQTDDIVIVPDLAYREGKSEAWKLDLVMPKAKATKPRPGIVFIHGGGWRSGDKRTGTFLSGAIDYAQKGYVCITINYRLINEATFPACVEDVKCAVRWLRANAKKYNVDPEHLGGYGNSASAHLVTMLGLVKQDAGLEGDGPYQDQSSLLQAVCASATPTDFKLFGGGRSQNSGLLKGDPDSVDERVRKASPINYIRKDAPPFLLIHGTADRTVNVKHADTFVAALKKAGARDVTFIRIDDAGHGVFNQHTDRTKPAMEKFFNRTLRGE